MSAALGHPMRQVGTERTGARKLNGAHLTAPDIAPPLPQNLDAERSVLGAILLDNHALNAAIEKLKPEDFFCDPHRRIFKHMIQLGEAQQAIDLVTLTDQLRRKGELEATGGAAYVAQLVDGVPRVSNLEHYARIIKGNALLRSLIYATESIKQTALDAEEEADVLLDRAMLTISSLSSNGNGTHTLFDTLNEFENTSEPTFSIKDFLQDYAVNAIAGLSGHGKTWVSMNIANALLFGPGLLWDLFEVTERAEKVIYLIPEASRATFKKRLQLTKLYDEIDKRLFVRTLTKGPAVELTDRALLHAAKGAHVICDTAIRFMKAVDENSASEAAQGLSDDFFALQRAEAKSIIPLFHSPKSFAGQKVMTLEGMIRGTTEFGAVLATAWGIRQIDKDTNTIHVQNLKDRDFQSCGPFQVIGRPFIDQEGSFRIHRRPGDCGELAEYLDDQKRGGAPAESRRARERRIGMVKEWLTKHPNQSVADLQKKFAEAGTNLSLSAVKNYRREALGEWHR
jgi:hypothetical protein